ncbi:OmpA family protein [candidate division KSB1 bacterium]|nr:OmpA family protein [candidate division KSB1 bacterium]
MRIYILALWLLCTVISPSFSEQADIKTDSTNRFITAPEIAEFLSKDRGHESQAKISDLELRLAIHFDLDSAELNEEARRQLDELAGVLMSPRFERQTIEMAGHSCDSGDAEKNVEIAEKRVVAARDYLHGTHAIQLSRLETRAYGDELPLFPGAKTEEERALNRRIVVYLPENRETIISMLKEMPGTLGFRWAVLQHDEHGRYHLVDYSGSSVLHSNDEYRIFLRPARSKYVYLFQQDGRGVGEWLFPRKDNPLKNPLAPGEYLLPNRSEVFALDNNTGRETIYCVVTEEPAPALEQRLGEKNTDMFAEAIEQTIKTRDLKRVRIGSPGASSAQTVYISAPVVPFSETLDKDALAESDIPLVMAQYRDFYMVVDFGHE